MINDLITKTETIIVEVPSTACTDSCDSPFAKNYEAVRAAIEKAPETRVAIAHALAQRRRLATAAATRFEPGIALLTTPVEITVKGIGFWDTRNHGKGHSKTGLELHPLIDIAITSKSCTAPSAAQIKMMLAEPDDDEDGV